MLEFDASTSRKSGGLGRIVIDCTRIYKGQMTIVSAIRNSILIRYIPVLLFILALPFQASAEPSPFRAVYKADYKGLPVSAKGIRELKKIDANRWQLTSVATSFLGTIEELSTFQLDDQLQLQPLEYQYHRKGIGKNRDATLSFDWQHSRVMNDVESTPWEMDIPVGTLDKLLYQLQMRDDLKSAHTTDSPWPTLTYQIADGGRLKQYEFQVLGMESVKTDVGKIDAVKVQRLRKDKDRVTTIWLAPDYDFLLVRLLQQEENGEGFELLLKQADFDGQPVKGTNN